MDSTTDPREAFATASDAVVELVGQVPDDAWDRPGLGEWSVRELVAHLLRAWSTVRDYLAEPVPDAGSPVLGTAEYLAVGLTRPGVHEGVADRARAEVPSLGDDPAAAVRDLAAATTTLVEATPRDRLLPTRFGVMRLDGFLVSRTFELVVHGRDLARATGLTPPPGLDEAAVPALVLLAEVAGERGVAPALLDALAGRTPYPADVTLLS